MYTSIIGHSQSIHYVENINYYNIAIGVVDFKFVSSTFILC